MLAWTAFGEQWTLNHPVVFDGEAKEIRLAPEVVLFDAKTDIYSNWKEWFQLYDNAKFPPAIRTIGGDPVGGGQFAGDLYFLINGWRIIVDHNVTINGNIFSDDYDTPFSVLPGGGVISKVSNLAFGYNVNNGSSTVDAPTVQEIRQEIDANSTKLDSIQTIVSTHLPAPSTTQISAAVRSELAVELAKIMTLENNPGLTESQATMLLEMYNLLGLDPTMPLVVTKTARTAGTISQTIDATDTMTTVTRNV